MLCTGNSARSQIGEGIFRHYLGARFEDPAAVAGSEEERLAAFRRIRDQIRERVIEFAATV